MEVIRKNTGAYRGTRWHYAVDGESTRTLCGRDVSETKGGRGSYMSRIERKSSEGMRDYEICTACRRKAKPGSGGSVKLSTSEMKALLARAAEAGETAFREAIPTPMIVYTPANVMGSLTGGDDGGPDPNEPVYYESEGICGSAWIDIRPGGSRFARWLKKEGYSIGSGGHGGVALSLWKICGDRASQSYARWDAAANAAAEVLREAGITAYAHSWVD